MEYKKFGLITVFPLQRFLVQDQEPSQKNILISNNNFSPKQDTPYELQMTVLGNKAISVLYQVRDNCLQQKGFIQYTFRRNRYGNEKRFPIALEITGDTKAIIQEIELISL